MYRTIYDSVPLNALLSKADHWVKSYHHAMATGNTHMLHQLLREGEHLVGLANQEVMSARHESPEQILHAITLHLKSEFHPALRHLQYSLGHGAHDAAAYTPAEIKKAAKLIQVSNAMAKRAIAAKEPGLVQTAQGDLQKVIATFTPMSKVAKDTPEFNTAFTEAKILLKDLAKVKPTPLAMPSVKLEKGLAKFQGKENKALTTEANKIAMEAKKARADADKLKRESDLKIRQSEAAELRAQKLEAKAAKVLGRVQTF